MKPRATLRIAAALLSATVLLGCDARPNSVSGASLRVSSAPTQGPGILPGRPVIVTPSDRGGAARLAAAMAVRLNAPVVSPLAVTMAELDTASLIGFGSGIFDQAHHKALLELADALPPRPGRKVFIFSTSGVSREMLPGLHEKDPHQDLRERLVARGCQVVGEYNCAGFNDNVFLFLIGGINKGRPNARDIASAEAFADSLVQGAAR
jgi:hypothetical protein